jgi:hypothetical protein
MKCDDEAFENRKLLRIDYLTKSDDDNNQLICNYDVNNMLIYAYL